MVCIYLFFFLIICYFYYICIYVFLFNFIFDFFSLVSLDFQRLTWFFIFLFELINCILYIYLFIVLISFHFSLVRLETWFRFYFILFYLFSCTQAHSFMYGWWMRPCMELYGVARAQRKATPFLKGTRLELINSEMGCWASISSVSPLLMRITKVWVCLNCPRGPF